MAFTRANGANLGTNQLLTAMLGGSPRYLGVIAASTAKNNSTTAVPFAIPAGALLLCQTDADVQWLGQSSSTATTTTANGVLQDVSIDGPSFHVYLTGDQAYLSCVGTANVSVWVLD